MHYFASIIDISTLGDPGLSKLKKVNVKKQLMDKEVGKTFFSFRSKDWFFGLLLFFLTLVGYQPAWNGKPIWDDDHHITMPALRSIRRLITYLDFYLEPRNSITL